MQCTCVYFHEVNVTLQSNLISPGTVQMSYLIYLSGKLRVLHICIKCLCTMEKLEIQVHYSVQMLYIDIDKQGCHPLEQNKSPIFQTFHSR